VIRVVLDTGVYVSAAITSEGPPGLIVRAWTENRIEVVASPLLIAELERVLKRPKFRPFLSEREAAQLIERIVRRATIIDDPANPPQTTRDPGDDYLVALAQAADAVLVSGDRDLSEAGLSHPVVWTPGDLIKQLDR
jgi:putative PIN family toxin of toxin-antitoxin system